MNEQLNYKYDVSVLVVIYNPDYYKLFLTLKSIVIQEGIKHEIVITDDGTPDLDIKGIENWFLKRNFKNYKIIRLNTNQGIVKNSINGLKQCEGKYFKSISPGDYLYDKYTLNYFFAKCEESQCKICFGNSVFYSNNSNEIIIYKKLFFPLNIQPFISNDFKRYSKQIILFRDIVAAPSFFLLTSLALKYYLEIEDKIKYAEDFSFLLMVTDGIRFYYFNRNIVWYEHGSGISTSNNKKWMLLLKKDEERFGEILKQKNKKWSIFERMNKKKKSLPTLFLLTKRHFYFNKKRTIYFSFDINILEKLINDDSLQ